MKSIPLSSPIKIWYKPLPRFPKISWPVVDIKLSYNNRSLPQAVLSLIDSGSSFSILHLEIVEALGIDLKLADLWRLYFTECIQLPGYCLVF